MKMPEGIYIDPETRSRLASIDVHGAPSWYPEVESPLTLEPYVLLSTPSTFEIILGNSGLHLFRYSSFKNISMDYTPNGDADPERDTLLEAIQNAGIWTLAFLRFLEWYDSNSRNLTRSCQISDETNPKMVKLMKTQLGNLDPSALTVFPKSKLLQTQTGKDVEEVRTQFTIRVGALIHATHLPLQQAWMAQVQKTYSHFVGNVMRINPRLKRQLSVDPDSGKPVYKLA